MSYLLEELNSIDMEYYLNRESIVYKLTTGSSGQQLNIKECPVCGNKNWKVYLNAESGLGNCFSGGCESRFNKYTFISSQMATSSKELAFFIKTIASECGWKPIKKAVKTEDVQEFSIPESEAIPLCGKYNLKYLSQRGITLEIAEYFQLRYCKKGWFKYEIDGSERFQRYFKRVIIPIHDLDGKLCTFQGRDITGESDRKYLFPPGLQSSGKHLYNGHNAARSEKVIITEGVFDTFSVKSALGDDLEFRNITPIATFGKHLSESNDGQMDKLARLKSIGLKEVTFMWDSERNALEAAVDAALKVSELGIKAKIAILPKGCDPNEAKGFEVRKAFVEAQTVNRSSALRLKLKINSLY